MLNKVIPGLQRRAKGAARRMKSWISNQPTANSDDASTAVEKRLAAVEERLAIFQERAGTVAQRLETLQERSETVVKRLETVQKTLEALPFSGPQSATLGDRTRLFPLSSTEILARTDAGFYVVVPSWNLDVAIGVVRDGVIEPWTNAVVVKRLRPGDVFINVGSNFGYYAILGAQCVGRSGVVHTVEANPYIFVYLLKSIYYAGYPDVVKPYCFAAFDKHVPEIELMFDPQFLGGGSVMDTDAKPAARGSLEESRWSADNVPRLLGKRRQFNLTGLYVSLKAVAQPLDDAIHEERPIRLMQMDIEGAEANAVVGARNLIRRNAEMDLILEWTPLHYAVPDRRPMIDTMWDFLLDERGYKVFRICPEDYVAGSLPKLEPLTREALLHVPHGDVYLTRED